MYIQGSTYIGESVYLLDVVQECDIVYSRLLLESCTLFEFPITSTQQIPTLLYPSI